MKRKTIALAAALALVAVVTLLIAQVPPLGLWVPVYDPGTHRTDYKKLGASFSVTAKGIDVVQPAAAVRHVRLRLAVDAQGNYPVPVGAKNLEVTLNRLPAYEGLDYTVVGGNLVPSWPWDTFGVTDGTGPLVYLDYEE